MILAWGPPPLLKKRFYSSNRQRDHEQHASLKLQGWRVLVVWDCELKNGDAIGARVKRFFKEY
jgi:G:T-mismatch repair DNA endonuclease (very short patch repair protein)